MGELKNLLVEKQLQLWFDIYGFNFAIVAGLFIGFFGWLLGRWRGMLADGLRPAQPAGMDRALGAEVVLLSVAVGDAEGRPYPQVQQAVGGRTLLRTDRKGWIELRTDGERMWVEVERI